MAIVVVLIAIGGLLSALTYLLASKKEKDSLAYSNERTWFLLFLLAGSVWAFPYLMFYGFKAFEWLRDLLG